MKCFRRMKIVGDELQVICFNDETNEEKVEFIVDMTDFYWEPGHLKDNVLINGKRPNEEFLENFCCDVPDVVYEMLDDRDIAIEDDVDLTDLFNELLEEMFGI